MWTSQWRRDKTLIATLVFTSSGGVALKGLSTMAGRKISPEDVVKEIESGMSDSDLIAKYGFSSLGFQTLATDLI